MQKQLVKLIFLFLIYFTSPVLGADSRPALPEYNIAVSTAEGEIIYNDPIKVGDQLRFIVQGPDLANGEINVDQKDLNEKGWQFLKSETVNGNLFFLIVPLKAGETVLPGFEIKSKEGNGIAKTQSITMKISSVITAEDSKPTEEVPWRPPEKVSFPWVLATVIGIISLTLLAYLFYWLFKKLSKKKDKSLVIEKLGPVIPDDEAALTSLEALEQSELLQTGKYKSFYFKASEIMKIYIGARYRFDAQESTAREILRHLERDEKLQTELVDHLDSLFQRMDRVKFTDYVPEFEHGRALIQDAKMFVLRTRKPKVSPVEKQVAKNAV